MKVKLEKDDVLEVEAEKSLGAVLVTVAVTEHENFCTLDVNFKQAGESGSGIAHYTLSSSRTGEMRLALFSDYDAIGKES